MAGFTEHGGEGGKAEIGFGGEPIGREDQQNLHLPAGGGFEALAIQENQLFRRSLTLRILYFHREVALSSSRMLKTASRKAAGKLTPEAYPLGYVEDVGEPRTMREVVFSILLEARSPFENSMRILVENLPPCGL
jgi:hypothetical protein